MWNRAFCLCDFSQTLNQGFQPIHLDFQHGPQQHAELAGWETLTIKPFEVGYREIGDHLILVFPKWHFVADQIFEDLTVRMC